MSNNYELKTLPAHKISGMTDFSQPCDPCVFIRMGRSGEDSRHCKSQRQNQSYHHQCTINVKERKVWVRKTS